MKIILGIVGIVVVAAAAWFLLQGDSTQVVDTAPVINEEDAITQDVATENQGVASETTGEAAAAVKTTFTLADVAMHNTPEDCYTAVRGTVYNLTAFVNKHPGGDKNILKICGLDGTTAFEGKHGGQEKPEATLAGFEIGTLTQ